MDYKNNRQNIKILNIKILKHKQIQNKKLNILKVTTLENSSHGPDKVIYNFSDYKLTEKA